MSSLFETSPIALRCVAAALLSLVLSACELFQAGDGSNPCACPGTTQTKSEIDLQCVPATASPVVTTSEDCTVEQLGSRTIFVSSDIPGICHVEVTFADGTMFSTDITIAGQWLACGGDPHGCGASTAGTPALVTLATLCGDSGVDAASSD